MLTATPDPFITVQQLKTHLKKEGTANDDELQTFVGAACQMIRDLVGEVAEVEATDVRTLRGVRRIVTEHRPVVSLDSATDADGNDITDAFTLANSEGVIDGAFNGQVTIRYTCGRQPVPDNITLAALELGAHLWRASQNGGAAGAPSFNDASDGVQLIGSAFALPIRVRELLGLGRRGTDEPLIA